MPTLKEVAAQIAARNRGGHKPAAPAEPAAAAQSPAKPAAPAVDASTLKSTVASFDTPKPDGWVGVPPGSCLDAALSYADRGWTIFPANGKKSYKSAKHSNGARWGAVKDPAQIRADFKKWPSAGIGLPTGVDNGIFVLDADTPKGHGVDGIANLAELERQHGKLPDTRMVESPSGSVHHYYRHPGNGVSIKNTDSVLAPGVDVRGDGGMVVAPPSARGDGVYRWRNNLPIVDAPEWLLKLVTTPAAAQQKASNVIEWDFGFGKLGAPAEAFKDHFTEESPR